MPLFLLVLLSSSPLLADDWSANGHDAGGTKHSALTQINPQNVTRLQVAWTYRTGDLYLPKGGGGRPSSQQTVPLYVDNTLYVTSAFGRVIALDPETGKPKWSFDPKTDVSAGWGDFANRGVATWLDPKRKAGEPCRRRIFVAPIDARLFAIDATSGAVCADFGDQGMIDLRQGLRRPPRSKDEYQTTSPPAILGELVDHWVVGSRQRPDSDAERRSARVRCSTLENCSGRGTPCPPTSKPVRAMRGRYSQWMKLRTWSLSQRVAPALTTMAANVQATTDLPIRLRR